MTILMDILEAKILKTVSSYHGQPINETTRKSLKIQIQAAIDNFCDAVNKNAPKPTMLFNFERDASKEGKLHLIVEFLHPEDNSEIALSEWQDEYEDGVTQ